MLSLAPTREPWMNSRTLALVCITLAALCHPQLRAQTLINVVPPPINETAGAQQGSDSLPGDPGQEILPLAEPEPVPATGVPIRFEADQQSWSEVSRTWTLSGHVTARYRDYVIRADKAVYRQDTAELDADGHLQLTGGPYDVLINASRGEMRLSMHTARFYDVSGSQTMTTRRADVYSTSNPLLFSGRVLIQNGEGNYRLIDGSVTNCRLPRPDWRILSRAISLKDGEASISNSYFEFLRVPVFYFPYLRHPANVSGRQSGFLIPVMSNGSSIRGFTFGEQFYWAINRSMDMVVGSEYFSKRGWAPNGDFRYRGADLNHFTMRWNALLDRGVEQQAPGGGTTLVDQGGLDVVADFRRDFSAETRLAGTMEYLSRYVYRLVFNDSYSQAISSQVASDVALTHAHNGTVPSVSVDRFQTFASAANGDEARILHLPALRFDVLDRPLGDSIFTWGLGSSLSYLGRSEPGLHARNVGRYDVYPHLVLPLSAGGWSLVSEAALRDTVYTISQTPDLTGTNSGIPTISHEPLNRLAGEASFDLRLPALERDFTLAGSHRTLRHIIEPELTYRYVGGIGENARNALLFDTTDIASDTNEVGYSLTQRLYVRDDARRPCEADAADCNNKPREWASWQIAQKYFLNPSFGSAVIPGRRNIFDATLDLTPVAFLTGPRNLSPVISRVRFEAINNLRVEWDLDYDPVRGQVDADNIYAGYSQGRTTVGLGYALLNAVHENTTVATVTRSHQIEPFLEIGKSTAKGPNLAVNGGYDFVNHIVQYAGVQAVYNWDCCGLTLGYRRFQLGRLGTVSRDETQWLYSFTLANFGRVGDIRRSNSVFRDSSLPPSY
jgi:LPS-assembly protein